MIVKCKVLKAKLNLCFMKMILEKKGLKLIKGCICILMTIILDIKKIIFIIMFSFCFVFFSDVFLKINNYLVNHHHVVVYLKIDRVFELKRITFVVWGFEMAFPLNWNAFFFS